MEQYVIYAGVLSPKRYKALTPKARWTHPIEGFTHSLRQRVPRFVGSGLSLSKNPAPHVGAMKIDIVYYNLFKIKT